MAAEAKHVMWRQRLAALRADVRAAFAAGGKGRDLVRQMCAGVDALLIDLWQATAAGEHGNVDIVAVGGYGRGELCPYSDWDLWFLMPAGRDDVANQHIQRFLYVLWDLRVQLGYAVRTIDDTVAHLRDNWDSTTAAMESRLLLGGGGHYEALQASMKRMGRRQQRRFIRAKLEEFAERRQRTGKTAFLMEPDVKEGSGGLRDIQALMWMAKAWYGADTMAGLIAAGALIPSECRQLLQARDFLWRLRSGLHLIAGRDSDRLDFETQEQLAGMLGYRNLPHQPAVERLMKHYFRHAGRVARITNMLVMHFQELLKPRRFVLCKNIDDGFVLCGRRLDVKRDDAFTQKPLRLLTIFYAAQQGRRRLSSHALRLIGEHARLIDRDFRKRPEANAVFLSMLREPRNVAWALKEMHDTGVLGRFIPEFGRTIGLGQFNRYHAYPVDEHTIHAVAEARRLRLGRIGGDKLAWVGEAMSTLTRPELLYLALIFHDLGKGRPEDHSLVGERLARRFCQRLGLDRDASELVSWLVKQHLLMAVTSQRCDLGDARVIDRFARQVGDLERLRYLLVLTVADIHAVGPNVWNDWKGSLLRELYALTEQRLITGPVSVDSAERIKARVHAALNTAGAAERIALADHLHALPPRALLRFPPEDLLSIGRLLMRCGEEAGVDVRLDAGRGETVVFIAAHDRPGLFADLSAAIGSGHVSVVAAHAFDLGGGRVLDVFHIQDDHARPLVEPSDQQRLCRRIDNVLAGGKAVVRAPQVKPHVLMRRVPVSVRALPPASTRQTAIEVVAADRPALLATLARTIADAGVNVRGAAISTFGEKAVDVFFLTDRTGKPLDESQIKTVCTQLAAAARLPEAA